jgi:DNA-directed RNA polymerase
VHTYPNITQQKMDLILNALRNDGASVMGNNPWSVNTHKFGVKLQGSWDTSSQTLSIIVTSKDFFVPCTQIWSSIDPLMQQV